MRTFVIALLAVTVGVNACAIMVAKSEEVAVSSSVSSGTQATTYRDAVKVCGAQWRARDDRATNKGRDAWQAFRASCVVGQGYVKRTTASRAKKG